jgi:hypothetical protein
MSKSKEAANTPLPSGKGNFGDLLRAVLVAKPKPKKGKSKPKDRK